MAASSLATTWLIVVRILEAHGINSAALLREVGIDPKAVQQPGARLPSRLADDLFAAAGKLIDDPAYALKGAQCWHPSDLGVLGYAWLSSRSLHRGLKRMERCAKIIGTRFTYRCVEEPAGFRFIYDHGRGDAPVGLPMADFALSVILDMCQTNFGHKLHPLEVRLRRPAPADPEPYRQTFACEVRFGALDDSFLIRHEDAHRLLPTANPELMDTFDSILNEQLAKFSDDDLVSRCKTFLLDQFTSGEPTVDALVKALGMSRRSLQRKLAERGLSYTEVLEETRFELAKRYLDDPNRSISQITFLLGYSEQSAFSRAFKRRSGVMPSTYRRRGEEPAEEGDGGV